LIILQKLSTVDKYLKISELSRELETSPRTIRYDLDEIDNFLKKNMLQELIRKPGCGVKLDSSPEFNKKLSLAIGKIDSNEYIFSSKERQKFILVELLRLRDFITFEYLSELLLVSRKTVISDIKNVKGWLEENELSLISYPGKGIKIQGEEKEIRRSIIMLLSEDKERKEVFSKIKTPVIKRINVVADKQIKLIFENLNMNFIEEAINMTERQMETVFLDSAYYGLAIHLALAIKRIGNGNTVSLSKDALSKVKLLNEFAIASSIANKLEKDFHIEIPEDEIGYITLHLLGGKTSTINTLANENWVKVQILTSKIIECVQNILMIDFKSDDDLYKGLIQHLGPTMYRLKSGISLTNPLLANIKNDFHNIFESVKRSLILIEEFAGCNMPDEEIAYIAMHFCASIERNKLEDDRLIKALAVCGSGIGTAVLLSSRLNSEFPEIEVVNNIPSHKVDEEILKDEIDLIITTVPTYCINIPEIIVSPLITEEDLININHFLKTHEPRTMKSNRRSRLKKVDDIIRIVENTCNIEVHPDLKTELSNYFKLNIQNKYREDIRPMLKDLLTDKTIKLNVEANNWEEAVRAGGEILEKNGMVEPRYIEAMVDVVKNMGPYVVIAPGIAMPHARPENGVNEVCMSLITLRKPVCFGNVNNDPVRLVICLGVIDNSTHLLALSNLATLFNDEEKIERIAESDDISSAISEIQSIESTD
jgi:transcriptional antiterminator/mannitol/fructose-specific phosphotransferase system IIA component (Ntr-type)